MGTVTPITRRLPADVANEAYPVIEITETYRVRGVVTQRAGRRRKDRKRYD